jgi:hypothetical protein
MKKYILAMASVAALGILIQSGCSGGGSGTTLHIVTTPGTLAVFGGDAPLCTVISFRVIISGLTLTPQSGGGPVSVLPGGNPLAVDFASLMDFATMFSLSNVPPGTYNVLGITLSSPELTYLDTSTTPASFKTITLDNGLTMSSLSISLNLSPAVTITSNGTLALQLDFNLLNSVLTNSSNQITGTVNPTFAANLVSASGSNGFVQFDDLRGLVQSVSTSSTNPSFVGSFTISSPNAPTFTIHVTSSTSFAGVSGLSGLTAGTFVEMEAFLDANANIVATTVEAEAQEDQASGKAAFVGLITSVTPQSGNATQFILLVQEENPEVSSRVALFSPLSFNIVPSSTTFGLTAQAADFANFSFGPGNLAVGQRVVVHGTLPSGSGTAQSATVRSVFLGPQSILGNLSTNPSTPVSTTDGVDGGFTLVPCSPLFQPAKITVLSALQTTFVGISNLYSLNSPGAHFLVVKGLLFYEQSTTSFGVEGWTVPANVQVAAEVHQLPSP